MSKYGHRPLNWFEAIVNKLGGEKRADAFLRDELVVSEPVRSWREENGVIYFSVTSDGTTGEDWITRLEGKGFRVSDCAKELICSPDFKPTNGVTYEIAVLKGMLFEDNDRITSTIRAEATRRNFTTPNPELACLIREKFTDKEIEALGLWWIVVMHESIGNNSQLLASIRRDGGPWLSACQDQLDRKWVRAFGFAFVMPQSNLIDCDAAPFIPDRRWSVHPEDQISSAVGGRIEFDPDKIVFYLDGAQKTDVVIGSDLRDRFKGKPLLRANDLHIDLCGKLVLKANVLDHLLVNPSLIPESWKTDEQGRVRYIFFWGTIYRDWLGRLYVRYLYWDGDEWYWDSTRLDGSWDVRCPAVLLASS